MTSEEVVKTFMDRIREIDPIINAMTDNRFEKALQEAKRADCMVKGMSPIYLSLTYPLLGVPFTVQQSINVNGRFEECSLCKRPLNS